MKFKIQKLFIIIVIFSTFGSVTYAATPSSQPTSSISTESSDLIDKLKQIEIFKEKIATKVAEIRNNEKAARFGNIKKIDKNTVTVSTKKGDQTVYYSDDTEIYTLAKSDKTKIQANKLAEGDRITAFGYFDTDKITINAKYIYVMPNTLSLLGKITDKDSKNFTISLNTNEGQTIIVDIETYTKSYSLDLVKKALVKIGFSKLNKEDIIRVIGTPNEKEDNRISATRILLTTTTPKSTPSESATPSATPNPSPNE